MNKPKLILIYTAILLTLLLIILWATDYSSLGIPEKFPGTDLQVYTVAMFAAMLLVLLFFQKHLLRLYPETSTPKLVLAGFTVCFFSQVFYQLFRQWRVLRLEENDKGEDYLISMAAIGILSVFLSLAIAAELKKTNPLIRIGSFLAVGGLLYLLKENFSSITW